MHNRFCNCCNSLGWSTGPRGDLVGDPYVTGHQAGVLFGG